MKKQELETLARNIIAQVIAGNTVEDSGVELKSTWLEAEKAARRLAAHANSARGDAIVWLMGIDEKGKKVVGFEINEMSNWINKLAKQFDGEPPILTCQANLHYTEGTVVALYFETNGSPYVIKNSKGGYPEFEVPYRRGNDTRSANRLDLLRILLPKLKHPQVTLFNPKLSVLVSRNLQGTQPIPLIDKFDWTFTANLYFVPRTKDSVVIPHVNCTFAFTISDLSGLSYQLPHVFKPIGKSLTIRHSASEIIIDGPGSVEFEAKGSIGFDSRSKTIVPKEDATINIRILPIHAEEQMIVRKILKYIDKPRGPLEGLLFRESGTWQ